jgi:hypothetical protein
MITLWNRRKNMSKIYTDNALPIGNTGIELATVECGNGGVEVEGLAGRIGVHACSMAA